MFNVLEHGDCGVDRDVLQGAKVLDMFAGSGALGFEALSRGAENALMIDNSRDAINCIRANASKLGLLDQLQLLLNDATKCGYSRSQYNLVFIDPPYANKETVEKCLGNLIKDNWLEDQAVIVVETRVKETLNYPDKCSLIQSRRYGNTEVHFLVYRGDVIGAEPFHVRVINR
jgi:16S rRNA (guanine966-N2)-methyltransferase